jgi:hypothetical protein
MKARHLSTLIAVAFAAPCVGAQNGDELAATVAQFYPASLDADVAAIAAGQANVRHQCWVVLRAGDDGQPLLVVAAYANSQTGAVRVLARGPAGFTVADEASGAAIAGSTCRAEGVDIDRDGMLEAVVRFDNGTGTNDWVYAWRDGALADLSPLTAEGVAIPVFNSDLTDLDGDGVLELRSRPARPSPSGEAPVAVFRLSSGSYVPAP